MKIAKRIIPVVMILVLMFCFSSVVYAATLHKVNGSSTNNGAFHYTSTTTATCSTLKASGTCDATSNKYASVVVRLNGTTVASGTIYLNGNEYTLTKYNVSNYPPGTYDVYVTPSCSGWVGVSTYFYY